MQQRLPDRDAIVEIADVPQEVRASRREPCGDDLGVIGTRVVLDHVDDLDAHRSRECLLTPADRAPVHVVDSNHRRAWGGNIHLRHQHVMREVDRHASQRAAGRDGAKDVVALGGDRIRDRAGLPINGLQLFGACGCGDGQSAAVSAEDRRHVVVADELVDCRAGCVGRSCIDHLQPQVCLRDLEGRLHPGQLCFSSRRLWAAQGIDGAQHKVVALVNWGLNARRQREQHEADERNAPKHQIDISSLATAPSTFGRATPRTDPDPNRDREPAAGKTPTSWWPR